MKTRLFSYTSLVTVVVMLAFALTFCPIVKAQNTNTGSVTDIDGNVYKTVKIGNQVWTVENLRTMKYNDGSTIPQVTDDTAWHKLNTPGYCWYSNDIKNKSKYGALYNWFAIDTKKLAPKGWHVPTDAEWTILENYLIANGYNWDGTKTKNKIAKSMAAKKDWETDADAGSIGNDLTKNNRSGFSALPGGFRDFMGYFIRIGNFGYWWSATEEADVSFAFNRDLSFGFVYLSRYSSLKCCGFSVRLVKD
jgi:uncharacterized protein (TIGR02145 family)